MKGDEEIKIMATSDLVTYVDCTFKRNTFSFAVCFLTYMLKFYDAILKVTDIVSTASPQHFSTYLPAGCHSPKKLSEFRVRYSLWLDKLPVLHNSYTLKLILSKGHVLT